MNKKSILMTLPILFATGCSFHVNGEVKVTNEGEESNYIVGGTSLDEGDATIVKINWLSGKIVIGYNEDNKFTFYEESKNNLSVETTLHYWNDIENSTLYLSPAATGTYKSSELKKDLFLNIPKDMELSKLTINCVAGDLTSSIRFAEANINLTSGSITMNSDRIGDLAIANVSGRTNLSFKDFNKINIGTVSGNAFLKCRKGYEIKTTFSTVSGKKKLVDVVESENGKVVDVSTVSGSLTISGELE